MSFILIIILSEESFKHGGSAKYWGYAGRKARQLCVKFCNFV
jgi:hypothetical protein